MTAASGQAIFAYVGAGADLGFLAYALAFFTWVFLSIGAVVLWPIRALLRRWKPYKPAPQGDAPPE